MSRLFLAGGVLVALLVFTPHNAAIGQLGKDKKSPAEEALAGVKFADENLKVEVWAEEPLLANPVAFAFDGKGRVYVAETRRFKHGVPDTRSHMYWLDEDLANRSIDDLLAMYKKHNFKGFEEYHDQLRMVWDSDGDGKADKNTIFSGNYNRPQDGLAAGVLVHKGEVFFTCIPDLYRLKDTDGDNVADKKESMFTGFGPTAQFLGHDLHGLTMGPDGKLYFSIGDRGFNVTTKEGKKLQYPNMGAVLRCELDGSNLEVVHSGLRNPQELAFDDYGNLFTYENNSDSGDQARWVHIVEGGDSGWRGGFQYGTDYHTPNVTQGNRGPWNTEKLWLPQWDGQPAYIVPPLANFGNGPAGLVYYPGVGLNDKYKGHFFACDFTANTGNSVIWTLAVKPKGASFEITKPEAFVRGMVPTDCDFGPDGAFYWSDWIGGWDIPEKGRIFRVTDPEAMKNPAVAEAKKLLDEGLSKTPADELEKLLGHPHRQVRLAAQYELVALKADQRLAKVAIESPNHLARLHAIWGLGSIARQFQIALPPLLKVMNDSDDEVKRAVIEQLGSIRYFSLEIHPEVMAVLRKLMKGRNARLQAAAAVAYGKLGDRRNEKSTREPQARPEFFTPLFDLLKSNDDKDPYLRHAAVMGMYHAARDPAEMMTAWNAAKDKYDVPAVRMGLLLTLRKHRSGKGEAFLNDPDPRIVAEAARAIYDTKETNAFPALARLIEKPNQSDAITYRALAACQWLSIPGPIAQFAARQSEADHARAFALKILATWPEPRRRDPITGLTTDIPRRDPKPAADALKAAGPGIFSGSDVVRREATQAVRALKLTEFGATMAELVRDAKQSISVRVDALLAAHALNSPETEKLAAFALESDQPRLRAAGRAVQAKLDPNAVLAQLPKLLKDDSVSVEEKQGAFEILAEARSSREVDQLLAEWLDAAIEGSVKPELLLDVLDAADERAKTRKRKLFAPLRQKLAKYRDEQARIANDPKGDKLAPYREAIAGGDAERGRSIFLNNSAVYCQRCHKLDGEGGEVGPVLNGIAAQEGKDRRYLLESIVHPNDQIAKGFDTVILILLDETTVSGVLKSEDKKEIRLVTEENKEIVVPVADVFVRRKGPSAMPADLHTKISRRELRDVVEFLASLKTPPKK